MTPTRALRNKLGVRTAVRCLVWKTCVGHTGRFVWLYSYELGALIFDVFFFSMNRYYAGDDSELAISLFFLFFFSFVSSSGTVI